MVNKQKRNICKQHTILNSTSDYPTRSLLQKNVDPVNRNEGGLAGPMKEIPSLQLPYHLWEEHT
jgi:hypothetical protein